MYACVSVLSQISNCQGLGRKNKHDILKTDRIYYLEQNSPSVRTFGVQPSSGSCYAPPDLVVCKPIFPRNFSGCFCLLGKGTSPTLEIAINSY